MIFKGYENRKLTVKEFNERVIGHADHVIETGETLRQTSKWSGWGLNTVHVDLTLRLQKICPEKYEEIKKILLKHKEEWHIRGGVATRIKYKKN